MCWRCGQSEALGCSAGAHRPSPNTDFSLHRRAVFIPFGTVRYFFCKVAALGSFLPGAAAFSCQRIDLPVAALTLVGLGQLLEVEAL